VCVDDVEAAQVELPRERADAADALPADRQLDGGEAVARRFADEARAARRIDRDAVAAGGEAGVRISWPPQPSEASVCAIASARAGGAAISRVRRRATRR
jgi:hypothetical protein